MAITIEEVTAEVEAPRSRDHAGPQAQPSIPVPSQDRRQRELIERIRERAARVCAD